MFKKRKPKIPVTIEITGQAASTGILNQVIANAISECRKAGINPKIHLIIKR